MLKSKLFFSLIIYLVIIIAIVGSSNNDILMIWMAAGLPVIILIFNMVIYVSDLIDKLKSFGKESHR